MLKLHTNTPKNDVRDTYWNKSHENGRGGVFIQQMLLLEDGGIESHAPVAVRAWETPKH